MDDNKKNRNAQNAQDNSSKKSDRTEFADELNTDMKNDKSNNR